VNDEQIATELLRRKRATESLIAFTEFTFPNCHAAPPHHKIAEHSNASSVVKSIDSCFWSHRGTVSLNSRPDAFRHFTWGDDLLVNSSVSAPT
jgi:hypothetical protein